jgi:hypothetical protein
MMTPLAADQTGGEPSLFGKLDGVKVENPFGHESACADVLTIE